MRKLTIALLAGAGALFVGSANASDIYTGSEYTNSDLLQPVRLVCDDGGRCYRTRGGSRVIVRDSYNYMRWRGRRQRSLVSRQNAGVGKTISIRPADFVRRASFIAFVRSAGI
jgi:hypothetical protein